jgi:uncharacterized protein YraI
MSTKKNMIIGAVAAAMVLVTGAAAMAATIDQTAYVRASLKSYAIVDTVYPGDWVSVGQCYSGYCYISHKGPDGWVKASAIDWNYGGYPSYGDWGYGDWGYDHPHYSSDDLHFCVGNGAAHVCVGN